MRLNRFIIVLVLFAVMGLLPSCSNVHMIALKPGERIIITREGVQQKGTVKGGNADEQDDDEGGAPERESNYFGQQHDMMQAGGRSPRNPFYKWDAIVGIGFTRIYGDLKYTQVQPAYKILVDRYLKKNVSLGLSFHHGAFSEYEEKNSWTDGLRIYNQFTSFSVNMRVSAGTNPAKLLHGLYAGIGGGVVFSNITNISTKFKQNDPKPITQFFPSSINTNKSIFYVPLDIGINVKVTKRFFVNLNAQFGYTFSDNLDGYNFQGGVKNKYSDMFSIVSAGFGYRFGK